jgi:hypothetical protein
MKIRLDKKVPPVNIQGVVGHDPEITNKGESFVTWIKDKFDYAGVQYNI